MGDTVLGAAVGIALAPATGGASLAWYAAGGAVVGSQVAQARVAKKAAYSARKAYGQQAAAANREYAANKKRADVMNVRSMRSNIRRARIMSASAENRGFQMGGGGQGGSALAGFQSSIGSQVAGNISYTSDVASATQEANQAQLEGAQAGFRNATAQAGYKADMAVAGAAGNVAGTIFSDLGGFK
jgi:hypothetical protein